MKNNWQTKKLSELTENLDSKRVPVDAGERNKRIGTVPYYGANGQIGWINDYLFDEPLLLVAEDGGNWGPFENSSYIITGKSWVNNHAHVLRCGDAFTLKYLNYYLNFKDLRKYISGTTRGKLNQKALNSIDILLPPEGIKEEIVERLDAIRKLQELNNKEIEKAEELFESLLNINFRPNKAYQKLNFEDAVVLKRGPFGGSLKKEIFVPDGYRVYEQRNAIYNDFTHCRYFITEERYKKMADFAVKAGDLIISCSGTIGKVALAPDNVPPGIINQALLRITPKRNIVLGAYLKYLIQSKDMQYKMFGSARGSSIKNIVSIKEIKKIVIHLPSIDEQQRIVKELDSVRETFEMKMLLKEKLLELFESTLNKAMKGELVN